MSYQHRNSHCGYKTIERRSHLNTIDSRYIAVIYNTIINTGQQLQWYNFGQTLRSRTTPHTSPSRTSYGVSFVRSWNKYYRDISRAHCNGFSYTGKTTSPWWIMARVSFRNAGKHTDWTAIISQSQTRWPFEFRPSHLKNRDFFYW